MRFPLLLIIMLSALFSIALYPDPTTDFESTVKSMTDSKEKVDLLNNEVDKILKPAPNIENCKKAKPIALEAAKIAENLGYKIGMARSYEQLTIIYKTLDYQIQYLKYRSKAALVDRGAEMQKQKEQIEKQKKDLEKVKQDALRIKKEIEVLEKDNTTSKEVLALKQNELAQKEDSLEETSGQLMYMTAEAERLENQNKLLEQEKKINELELYRQKLHKYISIAGVALLLFLAIIFFRMYKTKLRSTKELAEKNLIIISEKRRSDELLLNILPLETANELKTHGKAIARDYEMVTVLFTDFKDFTKISENLTPIELVEEVDMCFCAFDNIIEKHGIEKIKTIGDAYLCAHGIAHDIPFGFEHNPANVIDAAFEIIEFMKDMYDKRKSEGKPFFSIRIGIHSGPIVAGVVGRKKFAYDIWGDTVNTAARMEQNSEPGKINISSSTYNMVMTKYNFTHRGKIDAKNKGQIDMYFVDSKKS